MPEHPAREAAKKKKKRVGQGPRSERGRQQADASRASSAGDSHAPVAESPEVSGAVRISRRAADRLRAGHVWVYRSDVETWPGKPEEIPAGLLPVADRRGVLLGTALYSPASEIALRLVSTELLEGETAWLDILSSRLRGAVEQRRPLLDADNNAFRLVFSEADQLPGLTVDRYAGLVIVQLRHKALDTDAVRATIVEVLREALDPETIVEREDPRI